MTKTRKRECRNVDELSDAEIEKMLQELNLPRTIGQFFVGAMIGFKNNDLRRLINELYAYIDGVEAGYQFRIAELEQELLEAYVNSGKIPVHVIHFLHGRLRLIGEKDDGGKV